MQAQNAIRHAHATAAARNSTNTAPLPDTAALAVPHISPPPCDRWTELPVDVAVQVMYWTMLGAGTSRWATSLALTSTYFAQAGESFRAGSWFQDAQSVLTHDRSTRWTCAYIKHLGDRPLILTPKNGDELKATLEFMGTGDEGTLHLLNIEPPINPPKGNDPLRGFRDYRGTTLSLLTAVRQETGEQLAEIARALPPAVCLHVEFRYQVMMRRFDQVRVAGLVSRVATSGRTTGFNLKWNTGLPIRPAELGAVLDVACGPGRVSFFNFGVLGDPDAMLRALSDRCHRFRELDLVMFGCDRPPSKEALDALLFAMEKRRSAGQRRLTVVIDSAALRAPNAQAAPICSAEQRANFERAGLYVDNLASGMFDEQTERKILASVSGETTCVLPSPSRVPEIEPSSDSDATVDSRDSEADTSEDEAGIGPAARQSAPAPAQEHPADERSAPQVVQRDHCVIS